MAQWVNRLTKAAEADIISTGSSGALPAEAEAASQLFKALTTALAVYTETLAALAAEAADPEAAAKRKADRKAAEAAKAKAAKQYKAAEAEAEKQYKAAEAEATKAEAEAVQVAATKPKAKPADLMAVLAAEAATKAEALAAAEATKAEALATAAEALAAAEAEANSTIATLDAVEQQPKQTAAAEALAALKAALDTKASSRSTGSKTASKLADQNWLVGPHRDPAESGALLKDHNSTGVFAYNGSTRELCFFPTGSDYTAALAAARPMGLEQNKWISMGYIVDTKAANSLTGLQRYTYDVVRHASQYKTAAEAVERTNGIALNNNLAGNNSQEEPHGNAGGTVFCQPLTEALATKYSFTGFLPAEAKAEAAEAV